MISRYRRISKDEFPAIMKNGRSFFTRRLSLRTLMLSDIKESRFAFVVSAKNVKTAVERNLLKRRSRHVVYKHHKEIKGGFLCAFFLKGDLLKLKFSSFENEFIILLRQAKLIK